MPWSAESAARDLWSGLDKNATNGDAFLYFRSQLQAAYDAGARDAKGLVRRQAEIAKHEGDWPVVSALIDVAVSIEAGAHRDL